MLAPRLPAHTEHGHGFVASALVRAPAPRIWHVLSTVSGWPVWNPLVEWTSAQIRRESRRFTLLSASTLLQGEVVAAHPNQAAHLRFWTGQRPQPPALDCSVALEETHIGTSVVAHLSIEPWFLDALESRINLRDHTPATMFLGALSRVATVRPRPITAIA